MSRTPRQSLEQAAASGLYVDVSDWSPVLVDLRYGTKNNLLKEDVYEGYQRALLHPIAAEKFRVACEILKTEMQGGQFLLFDTLRPRSAQWKFWQLVVNTPMQPYFADPQKGSVHSFGFAIDLSLADGSGKELDMGTAFDSLEELAEPRRESEMLAQGKLTKVQQQNRLLLRSVMERAGFLPIQQEWWHFDALPPSQVRSEFFIVE